MKKVSRFFVALAGILSLQASADDTTMGNIIKVWSFDGMIYLQSQDLVNPCGKNVIKINGARDSLPYQHLKASLLTAMVAGHKIGFRYSTHACDSSSSIFTLDQNLSYWNEK